MTPSNDNLMARIDAAYCVVWVNDTVLIFDKLLEAKDFIDDYYTR